MSIPNQITALRLFGTFPLLLLGWLAVEQSKTYQYREIGILCAAAFLVLFFVLLYTDRLDGLIAREYNVGTSFGKFFDPTADKILILSALAIFAPPFIFQRTIVLFTALLVVEVLLFFTALAAYIFPSTLGSALGANRYGKIKVVVESILVVVLLNEKIFSWPDVAYVDGLWVAAILCVLASLKGHWQPFFKKIFKQAAVLDG